VFEAVISDDHQGSRRPRDVSTGKRDLRVARHVDEPVEQRVKVGKRKVGGQRERQEREARRASHGRDVRDVDRERLPAEVGRRAEASIEVDPFHQGIGGQDFEGAALGLRHRRIVANPDGEPGGSGGDARANCSDNGAFAGVGNRLVTGRTQRRASHE
jgi:hypothetical protein